jgi:hypothetical protein
VTRMLVWSLLGLGGAAIAWQSAPALQNVIAPRGETVAKPASEKPRATPPVGQPSPKKIAPPVVKALTPMAERVATVGLLNKRNGLWRDLTMKPGQSVRIGDVVVRLKACEATAPWEPEAYTGAFVQVIVRGSDDKWRKVFSGWLFKESPSLNVVEHPIYDVWAKACAMRHPDTGPDTLVVRGGAAPVEKGSRSKARKSPPAPDGGSVSADDSNTI